MQAFFVVKSAWVRFELVLKSLSVLFLTLVVGGCTAEESVVETGDEFTKPATISVAFVDLPNVADQISRQWAAQTGGTVKARELTTGALFENNYAAIDGCDIIVYPGNLMGQLAADDKISSLTKDHWNSEKLQSRSLLRHNRTTLIRFNRDRWAMSLGNPQFFLLIREDVLDALKVQPPQTWQQLLELTGQLSAVDKLTDSDGNELPTNVAVPATDGWATRSFLAIAAPSIRYRGKLNSLFDRRSMKPFIDQPPFVTALEELKRLTEKSLKMDPADVTRSFFSGELAIGVSWPAKGFLNRESGADTETTVPDRVLISRLPGRSKWYNFADQQWQNLQEETVRVDLIGFDCRLASVLTSSFNPTTAFDFLAWLSSKQTVASIFPNSLHGVPTRAGHLGDPNHWTGDVLDQQTADVYADLVLEVNEEPVFLKFPGIRGSHRYKAALEDSLQQFLTGDLDASSALQRAAIEWEKITEEYGRDKQIEMLRKDLDL